MLIFATDRNFSVTEGQYLLSFCNNLGPVYFLGFVLPLLHRESILPYLFGMYGIPLGYGILLRYTVYRFQENRPMSQTIFTVSEPVEHLLCRCWKHWMKQYRCRQKYLQLGGYMIFFNLLNLLPGIFLPNGRVYAPFFGDQRGVKHIGDRWPLYTLLLLPAGGLAAWPRPEAVSEIPVYL